MIRSQSGAALRSLLRHKGYLLLNLLGLAVGLAAVFLIGAYVYDDLRWDGFHPNGDRIYRINQTDIYPQSGAQTRGVTMPSLGGAIARDLPEVEAATRLLMWGSIRFVRDDVEAAHGVQFLVDSDFLKIFGWELVQGDPATALNRPDAVVIDEELASSLFGDQSSLGQSIRLLGEEEPVTVTGVFHQHDAGSHLRFDALRPISVMESQGLPMDNWQNAFLITYVMLADGANPNLVADKINADAANYRDMEHTEFTLEPLARLHLYSKIPIQLNIGQSNVIYVLTFVTVALLILLIAVVNYVNLATARALQKTRELAVRKVLGAGRGHLAMQTLSEAVAVALFAGVCALILVELATPLFETLAGRSLHVKLLSPEVMGLFLFATLLTGLVAGLYPAIVSAAVAPIRIFREEGRSGRGKAALRKTLVGLQFTITIGLIAATGIVLSQIHYLRTKPLGFDAEQVLSLSINDKTPWQDEASLKETFRRVPGVVDVCGSWNAPGYGSRTATVMPEGIQEGWQCDLYSIDGEGEATFGFKLVSGRFISDDRPSDSAWEEGLPGAVVLNEAAVKELGWEQPLGKRINVLGREGVVVGVIQDFHQYSLHSAVKPTLLANLPWMRDVLNIRFQTDDMPALLRGLEKVWRGRVSDENAFRPAFLDERFAQMYEEDARFSNILRGFSGLAILLASLGLIGLSSNSVQSRLYEVGVRKVLGAEARQILSLFYSEFVLLVLAGNLVAWPVTLVLMNRWLQNFAYRISPPLWVFGAAGLLALLIAIATISLLALRAVHLNPAEVLRDE